jgi:hypothetical protein
MLNSVSRRYITRVRGRMNNMLMSRNFCGYIRRFIRAIAGAKGLMGTRAFLSDHH